VAELSASNIFDGQIERETLRNEFTGFILETIRAGGVHGLEQVGVLGRSMKLVVDFDLTNPAVQQAIEEVLWQFTDEVTQTTQDALARLIAQAAEEGWSIPKLSDEISELFSGFKGPRAEVIARTEIIKAFNLGTHYSYLQSGMGLRGWLATLDNRARDTHMATHGQERPMGEPFDVGGQMLMYPGDPSGSAWNTINCRCTIYPVVR